MPGCALQPGDEITFQRVEVDSFGVTVIICTDDNHNQRWATATHVLPLHTIDIELVPDKMSSPAPSGVPVASGIAAAVGSEATSTTEYLCIDGAAPAAMSGAAASAAVSGLGPPHVAPRVSSATAPSAAVPGGFSACGKLFDMVHDPCRSLLTSAVHTSTATVLALCQHSSTNRTDVVSVLNSFFFGVFGACVELLDMVHTIAISLEPNFCPLIACEMRDAS